MNKHEARSVGSSAPRDRQLIKLNDPVWNYARLRGASSISRPTRYKITIKITNGIMESRSDQGPQKNGLFAVDQCSTRSLFSFQTPAKKAMNTAARAPPAM